MTTSAHTRQAAVAAWGFADVAAAEDEVAAAEQLLRVRFPQAQLEHVAPIAWTAVTPPPARLAPPPALTGICTADVRARLRHARGRSYLDMVALQRGDYATPPDVGATPGSAREVTAVFDWAADTGAAVIPFGGGTSVVGGVTPPPGDRPVITLSTRRLNRLLDVDMTSQAAHIEAGASGPEIELGR